ncbi:NUDIX hydrolase [Roseomonas rosulenta]|uniref:NUDIX hydrolase n=1 Tax=Roseomonas rosulenta TaxID=2748667 RepID=UPI001E33E6B8|nr:NUDIX hydrolase [Roseomonas rosulenta]
MTEPAREDPAADNPGGADAEGQTRRTARPRDAASLIVWRIGPAGPEILMGKRHARHRFMPDVMVFPGGRVDADDHRQAAVRELEPVTQRMLERRATPARARAIAIAAVRELHEETGLVLGERRGGGVAADLGALHYICRAVTPGRRPIRFNARFLAAPAEAVHGDIAGSGELERLDWYTPEAAHRHHVADITGKVLVEFLDWLEMSPRARRSRPLIVFRGMDNRHQER